MRMLEHRRGHRRRGGATAWTGAQSRTLRDRWKPGKQEDTISFPGNAANRRAAKDEANMCLGLQSGAVLPEPVKQAKVLMKQL